MLCGQVSKEEKKDSPSPKNDCVVFFSLAGSVENCILIVFVMCLRQTQTKTQYFPPCCVKFKFLLQELNVAIFVWKKLCALISTQIVKQVFIPLWKKLLLFGMISISITFWFKLSTTKYDILSWNDFKRKHWLPEGWRRQKDSLREGTNWLGHTISIFSPIDLSKQSPQTERQ